MGVYEKEYQAQRRGMDEHVCAEQKTRSVGLHEHGLILGTHRSPAYIYIHTRTHIQCMLLNLQVNSCIKLKKKKTKIYYNLAYSRISV